MFLSAVLSDAKEEFICDLAEIYHIYDFKKHPAGYIAVLAKGLPDGSRTKMKLSGDKVTTETLLLASAVDRLSFLCWAQTEDARKGKNRPESITELLTGKKEKKAMEFETPEDFEAFRKRFMKGGGEDG